MIHIYIFSFNAHHTLLGDEVSVWPVIVEFLVKFLEQEVCRLNWDVGFVTTTMQEIGVQLPRLLEVYDQLFKTRVHDVLMHHFKTSF